MPFDCFHTLKHSIFRICELISTDRSFQKTMVFLSLLFLFFLALFAFYPWVGLSIFIFSSLMTLTYYDPWTDSSSILSEPLNSLVIIFCFLLPPDHSLPDPGITFDLRSIMGAGLIWGNLESESFGCKKAFLGYFYLYYCPTKTAFNVWTIFSCYFFPTMLSKCPLFRVLHLLWIFERKLFAIPRLLKIYNNSHFGNNQ